MVALDYDYESVFPDQIMNCYKKRIQYLQNHAGNLAVAAKYLRKISYI